MNPFAIKQHHAELNNGVAYVKKTLLGVKGKGIPGDVLLTRKVVTAVTCKCMYNGLYFEENVKSFSACRLHSWETSKNRVINKSEKSRIAVGIIIS